MERTFYPGSEGEQTDNGIRIRGFYGMKKSTDAKYGDNGCAEDTHTPAEIRGLIQTVWQDGRTGH